jgi:MFS family permease
VSSAAPSDSDASQAYGSGRARYTLGLLLVMFIFGHIDRNILNVFIEQIKAEFGASDFVMGLLAGFYFVIFYTLAGVPIARLADRKSRKAIILCGLTLWSVMTALQGAVRAFWHLAAARVAVGVGEATISPSAHSIIADLYPPERRALPLGIYALGGHIGILIGFAFGGLVAERLGWRTAFVMVGLPGLVIAGIGWLTLREPARGQSEARQARSDTPGFGEVLRYLLKRRSFVHLNLAAALYAGVAGTFNVWGITFMQRIHGMGLAEAGVSFGLATGIPGVLGTLTSGWLVDRLASRDRRWSIWIPALGGVAMLPFSAAFVFADDPQLGLLAYAVQVFLSTFWMAPGFATGQALAKLQMRATAAAIFLLVINVLGLVVLPALVGAASDLLSAQYGSAGLRYALLGLASFNLWGVCHSLLMSRSLEADLAAAAAD